MEFWKESHPKILCGRACVSCWGGVCAGRRVSAIGRSLRRPPVSCFPALARETAPRRVARAQSLGRLL